MRQVEDEGTEADDEPEIIFAGGPLSIVGGGKSEGVTFEGLSGELVSCGKQTMLWTRLDYRYVSFQTSKQLLTLFRISTWPVVPSVK